MTVDEARFWAQAGVLAALALVLSYIETFIPLPLPVPGVKLGLANIVVLVALVTLDVRSAAVVALIKVLAAGFMFGNPVMMLYSLGGTLLAFASMAALSRLRGLSLVLVAVVGAVLHNVGQLAVASALLGTPAVWASLPVLVIAACATGALSGAATRYAVGALSAGPPGNHKRGQSPFMISGRARRGALEQAAGHRGESPASPMDVAGPSSEAAGLPASQPVVAAKEGNGGSCVSASEVDSRVKLACLAVFVISVLHARTPVGLGLSVLVAAGLAAAARMGAREAARVLRPLWPVLVITIIMQVLYLQNGPVLVQLGPVAVTAGALAESARMVIGLFAIMLASVAFMRVSSTEELVRTLRWLLAPVRAAGFRSDAFILSLSVAFRFIPVFVEEFHQLKRAQEARAGNFDGTVCARLAAYMRLFAPLLRSSYRRADTLAEAFLSRCFSCGVRSTSLHESRIGMRDVACLACALSFCLAVCLL